MAENEPKGTLSSLDYEGFVRETYDALVSKNLGQVLASKRYRGKRSGHNHQIDVSIELEVAGLAILILVECKYYKRAVEVSDILEFAQRIDDIGAHKGVLVSTVGFQKGAIKIASGHGIALVQTEPAWEHVLYCRAESLTNSAAERAAPQARQLENLTTVNPPVSVTSTRSPKTLAHSWIDVLLLLTADPKCPLCRRSLWQAEREAIVDSSRIETYNASVESWFEGLLRNCPDCSLPIDLEHFEKGKSWKKCECGKMIHIGDVDVAETRESYRSRRLPEKTIWVCGCSRVFSREQLNEIMKEDLVWLPDNHNSDVKRALWW